MRFRGRSIWPLIFFLNFLSFFYLTANFELKYRYCTMSFTRSVFGIWRNWTCVIHSFSVSFCSFVIFFSSICAHICFQNFGFHANHEWIIAYWPYGIIIYFRRRFPGSNYTIHFLRFIGGIVMIKIFFGARDMVKIHPFKAFVRIYQKKWTSQWDHNRNTS